MRCHWALGSCSRHGCTSNRNCDNFEIRRHSLVVDISLTLAIRSQCSACQRAACKVSDASNSIRLPSERTLVPLGFAFQVSKCPFYADSLSKTEAGACFVCCIARYRHNYTLGAKVSVSSCFT